MNKLNHILLLFLVLKIASQQRIYNAQDPGIIDQQLYPNQFVQVSLADYKDIYQIQLSLPQTSNNQNQTFVFQQQHQICTILPRTIMEYPKYDGLDLKQQLPVVFPPNSAVNPKGLLMINNVIFVVTSSLDIAEIVLNQLTMQDTTAGNYYQNLFSESLKNQSPYANPQINYNAQDNAIYLFANDMSYSIALSTQQRIEGTSSDASSKLMSTHNHQRREQILHLMVLKQFAFLSVGEEGLDIYAYSKGGLTFIKNIRGSILQTDICTDENQSLVQGNNSLIYVLDRSSGLMTYAFNETTHELEKSSYLSISNTNSKYLMFKQYQNRVLFIATENIDNQYNDPSYAIQEYILFNGTFRKNRYVDIYFLINDLLITDEFLIIAGQSTSRILYHSINIDFVPLNDDLQLYLNESNVKQLLFDMDSDTMITLNDSGISFARLTAIQPSLYCENKPNDVNKLFPQENFGIQSIWLQLKVLMKDCQERILDVNPLSACMVTQKLQIELYSQEALMQISDEESSHKKKLYSGLIVGIIGLAVLSVVLFLIYRKVLKRRFAQLQSQINKHRHQKSSQKYEQMDEQNSQIV